MYYFEIIQLYRVDPENERAASIETCLTVILFLRHFDICCNSSVVALCQTIKGLRANSFKKSHLTLHKKYKCISPTHPPTHTIPNHATAEPGQKLRTAMFKGGSTCGANGLF